MSYCLEFCYKISLFSIRSHAGAHCFLPDIVASTAFMSSGPGRVSVSQPWPGKGNIVEGRGPIGKRIYSSVG